MSKQAKEYKNFWSSKQSYSHWAFVLIQSLFNWSVKLNIILGSCLVISVTLLDTHSMVSHPRGIPTLPSSLYTSADKWDSGSNLWKTKSLLYTWAMGLVKESNTVSALPIFRAWQKGVFGFSWSKWSYAKAHKSTVVLQILLLLPQPESTFTLQGVLPSPSLGCLTSTVLLDQEAQKSLYFGLPLAQKQTSPVPGIQVSICRITWPPIPIFITLIIMVRCLWLLLCADTKWFISIIFTATL